MKPQSICKTTRGGELGKGMTRERIGKKIHAVPWGRKLLLVKQLVITPV